MSFHYPILFFLKLIRKREFVKFQVKASTSKTFVKICSVKPIRSRAFVKIKV